MPLLSRIDKMILKEILSTNENKTSGSISKKFNISLTTVQRRRKRLEKEFLEEDYTFLFKKNIFEVDTLFSWADYAHGIAHDLFQEIIKPHLYASFSRKN